MSIETSRDIVQQALVLGNEIDSIFVLVRSLDDVALRDKLIGHVEQLVQHGNALILNIEGKYPELNPDK
jgi:hypothetical protein